MDPSTLKLARAGNAPPIDDKPASKLEHFIPIRKAELIDQLCRQSEVSAFEATTFRQLCRLLDATLHFEYHAHLDALKNAYAPFDPDADTQPLSYLDERNRLARLDELFGQFNWLLQRANFRRLSRADMQQALAAVSDHGLRVEVDFNFFERLEMYCRGDVTVTHWRAARHWLFRPKAARVPIYQRLVIIFRLRDSRATTRQLDSQNVFIKIFKDVPKMDLEMLLPGTRVKMSLKDRIKILMPTASGIAISIYKAVKGVLLAAAAGIYGTLTVVGVTAGYGMRSFYGYLQTRQKYQLNLTESLYYQNLDNNAGVLTRLLDEAEEQENREVALAYFFLWRQPDGKGKTAAELDRQIEQFLFELLGRSVDFEVDDALAKLSRMGLARQTAPGRYVVRPIVEALQVLDRSWDKYFSYNQAAA